MRRPKKYSRRLKVTRAASQKVHSTGYNGWPKYLLADVTLEASHRRLDGLQKLLVERGKFSKTDASKAVMGPDQATKEAVARWLSAELEALRKAEAEVGAAPVGIRGALSRLDIANLAQTMLECLGGPPGDELLCLLQSLLNIDRHRRQRARIQSEKFESAASLEGQAAARGQSVSARKLAPFVGVSQPALSAWRKMDTYKALTEMYRQHARKLFEPFMAMAAAKNPSLSSKELYLVAIALENDDFKKQNPNIEMKPIEF